MVLCCSHTLTDVVVFDAVETGHSLFPKRKADQELPHLVSSELKLAETTVVVSDISVNSGSDAKTGTMPAILETDDIEAAVAKAVAAGAVKVEEEVSEVKGEGEVKGKVTDPFGLGCSMTERGNFSDSKSDSHKDVETYMYLLK